MEWEIRGADRETGQRRADRIQAHSEEHAIAIANSEGLLVSSCVPVQGLPHPVVVQAKPSRAVAALLSFLIPGLGQFYRNEVGLGLMFLLLCIFLYALIPCTFGLSGLVGLGFHLISIVAALT